MFQADGSNDVKQISPTWTQKISQRGREFQSTDLRSRTTMSSSSLSHLQNYCLPLTTKTMSLAPIAKPPAEMLGEITAHTTGLADLIRLSRTCKTLYRFLASSQSRYIWKAKIASIGLPACPASLSVYAYANLVCFSACQRCDAIDQEAKVIVDWDLRVRLCKDCLSAAITVFDEAKSPVCLTDFPSVKIRDLVHVRRPTVGCAFVTEALDAMKAKLDNMEVDDRVKFISRRTAIMTDARVHARVCREWAAGLVRALLSKRPVEPHPHPRWSNTWMYKSSILEMRHEEQEFASLCPARLIELTRTSGSRSPDPA
ncbi:F-box domain-containing protein [Mycena sanguinolenta]|uniref:F-box domain-containing protein n=1 Tax=Mycena sanguinolenta TaxID=230812 RepID=A0A8H6ZAP9_9AGAR|nr:F-box domain-containing protein [Mycena sanguinolenta]